MNDIPKTADIVVIGGGPGGSTAANLLAKKGYEVVLFDQERHPRPTVGESILPHMWKYADMLGVTDDINDARFITKSGGLTVWNGTIRQARLSDFLDHPGLHVERDEFDHILLNGARRRGVQVFEEIKVREVHLDSESDRGVTWEDRSTGERGRLRCRMLIDASGQAAVIANQLRFRTFDPDLRFMSVWGYFEDSDYVSAGGAIRKFEDRYTKGKAPVTFVSGVGEWGWCWHMVQKHATSVGLVLEPKEAAAFKAREGSLEQRFEAAMRDVPVTNRLLEPSKYIPGSVRAIRDFAYRPTRLCGEGWYTVGDASSFVDPINSAGVLVAFYTGSFSAWAVSSTLEQPDKAEYFRSVFDSLVRQRVSLYRISALPEGVNSHEEDYPLALKAARLEKKSEQELLLVQTYLTHRRKNLERLYQMDNSLKYEKSDLYQTIPYLQGPNGEQVFAAP